MIRRVASVLGGFIMASFIFMVLQAMVSRQFPPPENFNVNDTEAVTEYFRGLPSKMFIMLTLSHAFSALIGAFFASVIADKYKIYLGLMVGLMIVVASLAYVLNIPVPTWMIFLDPLAILICSGIGAYLGSRKKVK